MLVDINLLPEKEKKNIAVIIVVLVLAILLITISFFSYKQYNQSKAELKSLQQELEIIKNQTIAEQNKLTNLSTYTAVSELQNATMWIEEVPVSTTFFISHLAGLLPERGFITRFSYSVDGIVNIDVQFDTSREAAYYLQQLTNTDLISNANIKTVTSVPIETVEENTAESNKVEAYLPRYVGTYEIHLNRTALKAAFQKEGTQ